MTAVPPGWVTPTMAALRRFKRRETLRISYGDIIRVIDAAKAAIGDALVLRA